MKEIRRIKCIFAKEYCRSDDSTKENGISLSSEVPEKLYRFLSYFFSFPEEQWISLRTINIIERLNKKFKRRTKPMEIVVGEKACYRLFAFVSLKMELHWRSNSVGKVNANLTFFEELLKKIYTK